MSASSGSNVVRPGQDGDAPAQPSGEASGELARTVAQLQQAVSLFAAGRHPESLVGFERTLSSVLPSPDLIYSFGVLLFGLEKHEAAVETFSQALALQPAFVDARVHLGRALAALGRHDEALSHYTVALDAAPNHAAAHCHASLALEILNRPQDALNHAERSVEIAPESAEAQFALGQILVIQGRLAPAKVALRRALQLAPFAPAYYRAFGEWFGFGDDPDALAALFALAQQADERPDGDRLHLFFALHKALEDQGRSEEALDYLIAANAIQRRRAPYEEADALGLMARIRAAFGPERLAVLEGAGEPSRTPIFIVGMPRSGTTLVEQILAAHPDVVAGGELTFLSDVVLGDLGAAGPHALDPARLKLMGRRYVARLSQIAPAAVRITDKMPGNFVLIGMIRLMLPHAHIIHVRRDPLDTCLSCFSKLFPRGQPFANDLGELGRYYRGYRSLMAHWRRVLPAGVLLEVDYEDLVKDFQPQAARILAHCGLAWSDACLAFDKAERPVRTASAAQVRQPIYTSSIGRALRYGDRLKPLLEALGDLED